MANAYARCGVSASVCDALFEDVANLAVQSVDELVSQDVANLANAFAKLDAGGRAGQELLLQLARNAKLSQMEPAHLAALAWAYARLQHPEAAPLLRAIAEELFSSQGFHRFSTQEIVNLLSAFAKTRVRHEPLLKSLAHYLKEKPQVIAKMVPLDVLYTASSLARMKIFDPEIYGLLAQNILLNRKVSAKQGIYLMQSFSQAQCLENGLVEALAPILHQALQRGGKDPNISDWVVALGALSSVDATPAVDTVCEGIIHFAMEQLNRNLAISGLNISQLLRALSRIKHLGVQELTQRLLWRLLDDHRSFTVLDLVSAVHSAVTMYEEDGFGVTPSLFNCLLNLLIQELTVGQRMSGLSCPELMAVSSTLSKAGSEQTDLEGEREAWTVVMRETSRLFAEDPAAVDQMTLLHTTIVVLNCCARVQIRDATTSGWPRERCWQPWQMTCRGVGFWRRRWRSLEWPGSWR